MTKAFSVLTRKMYDYNDKFLLLHEQLPIILEYACALIFLIPV